MSHEPKNSTEQVAGGIGGCTHPTRVHIFAFDVPILAFSCVSSGGRMNTMKRFRADDWWVPFPCSIVCITGAGNTNRRLARDHSMGGGGGGSMRIGGVVQIEVQMLRRQHQGRDAAAAAAYIPKERNTQKGGRE